MRRRRFLRSAAASSLGVSTVLAGCSSSDRATVTPPQKGDILMTSSDENGHYFDPIGLYVEPGDTVVWANWKGIHTTSAFTKNLDNGVKAPERRIPEDAQGWHSGSVREYGATVGWTFEIPGTYDYYCDNHKTFGMVGRIVVGEPGGPATDNVAVWGAVPDDQRIVEEGRVSFEDFDQTGNPIADEGNDSSG